MSYVETIVGPDERVMHVGRVSLLSIIPSLIGGAALVLVALALLSLYNAADNTTNIIAAVLGTLGLVMIAAALVRRSSTELAVTTRRVIAKFGFISRRTVEMNLSKIESVRVDQSIFGRMFGFGSLVVVGTGSSLDPIPFIDDPIAFRQAIQAATDALPRA